MCGGTSVKQGQKSFGKNDAVISPENSGIQSVVIDDLQEKIRILSTRCSLLEAQNIIIAVQQLDLLAQSIAIICSFLSLLGYWVFIFWLVPNLWDVICTSLASLRLLSQHPVIAPLANIFKYILAAMPYFHHRRTYGLIYRRYQVFAVAAIILIRVKLCRWRVKLFATSSSNEEEIQPPLGDEEVSPASRKERYGHCLSEDAIWEAHDEVTSRFLYASTLRLRGLWTKTAQYLSSRADFMPESYVRELKKLQDEAPNTPWKDVQKILQNQKNSNGNSFLQELTNISQIPIASASIGQIHTANLSKTNDRVVIKVQHPFARTLLSDDFRSLKIITRVVAFLEPEYAFMEILMSEWAKESKKELDFVNEAQNLLLANESIDQIYKVSSSDERNDVIYTNPIKNRRIPFQIEIPSPIRHLCARDVLVMTYCEGTRVDNVEQITKKWNLSKDAIMDGLTQAFAHMMYTSSIFNGDPHPGNIFVRPGIRTSNSANIEKDGSFTIVLLDWGLAKCLPREKQLGFCQLTYAASTLDLGMLLDSFKTIGLKMKREDTIEDLDHVRFLLRDIAPRKKQVKLAKAQFKKNMDKMKGKKRGEKVPMESKAYPGEFFFFVRVHKLLQGLGSKLNLEMSYMDVLTPYAERGILAYNRQSDSLLESTTNDMSPKIALVDKDLTEKLNSVLLDLQKNDKIAGAQVCVVDSQGRTLSSVVQGHRGGLKKSIPMCHNTLILGYSCTKAIATTMAHIMVDQGYLTYDEPICERVWKAFCPFPYESLSLEVQRALSSETSLASLKERWTWKRSITLRHILTHSAGLWSSLPKNMTIKSLASCESCVEAFEYKHGDTLLPTSKPGEKTEYHFMSFGWLVAGTLCGAYSIRHAKKVVTFEELYEAILASRLSTETIKSGFRPCGGDGGFPVSQVETNSKELQIRIVQMRGQVEAAVNNDDSVSKTGNSTQHNMSTSFKGKEFLLDQRIWNCEEARHANVPAAGGRFSASGLARFYHDLGSGKLLSAEKLDSVSAVVARETAANDLQGETNMTSSNADSDGIAFGMGYQLICFENDKPGKPSAFGHVGVGGSLGFHHKKSSISVAIMFNKADGEKATARKIVHVISKHFQW